MMFNWFKKKEIPADLPDFWQEYSASFDEKIPEDISNVKFVVFDTETTGFDFENDRILSMGAVIVKNKSIDIRENLELYLEQTKFNPATVKIHGIIQNDKYDKVSEIEAIEIFLRYIKNSVLVAHHAGFDIKMVNKMLKRHNLPKLKNPVIDTAILYKKTRIMTNLIDRDKVYSLDEIAEAYNIELTDRHTASGDAYITAIIFMKLLGRIVKPNDLTTKKLLRLKF